MELKPSTIFIGVTEFFSVILPGALLTSFLWGLYGSDVFGGGKMFPEPTSESIKWAVFLLVSYIVGKLVFMLSSFLDGTYDGFLRKHLFQSKHDLTFKVARQIQRKQINPDVRLKELPQTGAISDSQYAEVVGKPMPEILNTFKWAQHYLLFNKPEALAVVRRVEADSKFFRSLVVAFLIIALLMFVQAKDPVGWLFVGLSVLCYYRYGELRFKATEKAYEMIITLFTPTSEKKPKPHPPLAAPEDKHDIIVVGKADLTPDFSARHRELISFLSKGFIKAPKQLVFTQGGTASQHFIADRDEFILCVRGRGILRELPGGKPGAAILLSNAMVPLKRQVEYSVVCAGDEPVEILSWES